MTKYTMTVHEGLAELKTLASRIEKELSTNLFVCNNKHANTKIDGVPVSDFEAKMKSNLQKVEDLINRRNAIKRAITKSNAVTEVTLRKDSGDTVTMTVAEVIEYKNIGIQHLERLLNTLSQQYNAATREITLRNNNLDEKADAYVASLFGSKEGISADVITSARQSYVEANTLDLVDPNSIVDKINTLREEIDFYNTKVDAALSTSNAVTIIEFEC